MKDYPDFGARYEIMSILGEGGMGSVYLGRDLQLNRRVAIKTIRKEALSSPNIVQRTLREGKTLAQLNHPSLVAIYDMDMTCPVPYIVQEYVDGKDLGSYIERKKFLDETGALKLVREQAQVLSYLHEKGIYHRDLKPENIMIDDTGRSRLMDFGLALSSGVTRMTAEGNFVGTVKYCAPEVLAGKDGGGASDIFQLGVVLYEVMTGEALAGDFDTIEEFIALLFDARWEREGLPAKLSSKMSDLIMACVRSEPNDRLQDGRALLKYLDCQSSKSSDRKQRTTRTPSIASSSSSSTQSPVNKIAKRKRWLAPVLLSCFLLVPILYLLTTVLYPSTPVKMSGEGHVSSIEDFSLLAREWLLLPDGFYIFLPTKVGTKLRWEFLTEASINNESTVLKKDFKKVAGGWKTLCSSVTGNNSKSGVLSIFDGDKLLAKGLLAVPESLFNEPFKAIFAYDSIHSTWKFYGKIKTSILLEQLDTKGITTNSVEMPDLDSECVIRLKELGFSGLMRLTLKVSGISRDEGVFYIGGSCVAASKEGHSDFTLKCQFPLIEGRKYSGYQFAPSNDGEVPSNTEIGSILSIDERLYVTTDNAELHCFRIDATNVAFYENLWSKNLFSVISDNGEKNKNSGFWLSMPRDGLLKTGDGVSLHGLNLDGKMHSFDRLGNYSTSKIPLAEDDRSFRPIKVVVQGTTRLLNSIHSSKDRRFYLWEESSCNQVLSNDLEGKSNELEGKYSGMYPGIGTFFLWYSSDKAESIYYLQKNEKSTSFRFLGRYPSLHDLGKLYFASEQNSKHALFCLKNSLYLVRGKSGVKKSGLSDGHLDGSSQGFTVEELHLKIPSESRLSGILSCGDGKYLCAYYTGLSDSSLLPTGIAVINLVSVVVTDKIAEIVPGGENTRIPTEYNRRSFAGPMIIDEATYCLAGGATFYIIRRKDNIPIYKFDFYSSVKSIVIGKNAIFVEANTDGLIYGLNLPPAN